MQKLPEPRPTAEEADARPGRPRSAASSGSTRERLLHEPVEELLARGFSGHDLRLFRGAPVQFECRCNAGRVAGLLRALGADEVRDVLQEQGAVTVTCEFCQRPYRFDAVDVEALF